MLSGSSFKDKKELIEYLQALKTTDEKPEPLFNGYQISQIVRKNRYWDKNIFRSFYQLFESVNLPLRGTMAWTIYKNERAGLVKEWAEKPFEQWSLEARRLKASLVGHSRFDLTHALQLGLILFQNGTFSDFEGGIKKSADEEQRLLDDLKNKKQAVNDAAIKRLVLSFNPQIRSEVRGIIYEALSNTILVLSKKYQGEASEAIHQYQEHYDWTRPNAGIENLKRNLSIIAQYHKPYLFWLRLPASVKTILIAKKTLERKGLDKEQIKEILLGRGYTEEEISTGFNFRELSLDKPLQAGEERTLYDVIEAGTAWKDEITFEDDDNGVNEGEGDEVAVEIFGTRMTVQARTVGEALRSYWAINRSISASEVMTSVQSGNVKAIIDGEEVDLPNALTRVLSNVDEIIISRQDGGEKIEKEAVKDKAMIGTREEEPVGGIDLSFNKLILDINTNGQAESGFYDPQTIKDLKIDGLIPFVSSVVSVVNLQAFFLSQASN